MNDSVTLVDRLTRSLELLADLPQLNEFQWLIADCLQCSNQFASHLGAGSPKSHPIETFDIQIWVCRIFHLLKLRCAAHQVPFNSTVQGVSLKLLGYPSALSHILIALVSGGLHKDKPTPGGSIACDIRSSASASGSAVIEIRIQHHNIFLNDNRGLGMCRELVRRMGGDLVFTQQNENTMISFSLILPMENSHQNQIPASYQVPAYPISGDFGNGSIGDPLITDIAEAICDHVAHWKRLRTKRGITSFVCTFCSRKWRSASGRIPESNGINGIVPDIITQAPSILVERPKFKHSQSASSFFACSPHPPPLPSTPPPQSPAEHDTRGPGKVMFSSCESEHGRAPYFRPNYPEVSFQTFNGDVSDDILANVPGT